LSDLEVPISSLYLLAAPSTPESACEEVITRAESGERLKHAEVQAIIATAFASRSAGGCGSPAG
jgi:hypothetical protein